MRVRISVSGDDVVADVEVTETEIVMSGRDLADPRPIIHHLLAEAAAKVRAAYGIGVAK